MATTITCGNCNVKAGKVTKRTPNNTTIRCPKCGTILVKGE